MPLRACLIPGDGIGPEVTGAARRVLDAACEIEWQVLAVGSAAHAETGDGLPEAVVESIRDCGLALKGPVATAVTDPFPSVNVALRRRLDLFLGARPSRSLPGSRGIPGADLAVLRMHDGDLYAGYDYRAGSEVAGAVAAAVESAGDRPIPGDAGITLKPISRAAAERAARAALAWAVANGRGRVTIVHKANVMRATDGAFLEAARAVAAEFPGIEVDDSLVDRVCADLVRHPYRFDILLCPMLYGDIVSDLAAALCGGLGLAPGANLGDGCAVFEAVHGSAPRHAGRGSANPVAAILSGAMMLRHGGEPEAAARVEAAVDGALADGIRTADLEVEEPVGTAEMAAAIVERLP